MTTYKNKFTVKDKEFELYMEKCDVQHVVQAIAFQINKDYKDKNPIFLVVLNGAFMFASDLLKSVITSCEVSFIKLSSYNGTQSTGNVKTVIGLDIDIKDREVVIIEDIIDTGKTINELVSTLQTFKPKNVQVCSFFRRRKSLLNMKPTSYTGSVINDGFVIGYGMDYDGFGRNLDNIYIESKINQV